MAKNIFNKSIRDKISSPDQIDKAINITSAPIWLFICGGALIILVALIWSLTATLSITKDSSGIIVSNSNSNVVSSKVNGIITKVNVQNGDNVKKGDVICEFDGGLVADQLKDLKDRREKVDKITINSVNDNVTSDVADLISIKSQLKSSGVEVGQSKVMLNNYYDAQSELSSESSTKEAVMNQAKEEYAQINLDPTATPEQKLIAQNKYETAAADYQATVQKLEAVNSQIETLKAQIDAGNYATGVQTSTYQYQFNSTKKAILNSFDNQIKEAEKTLKDYTVLSPKDGVVMDLKVSDGLALAQGSPIFKIKPTKNTSDVLECFISIQEGKSIKKGMNVIITPTNINEQDYGHMNGTVTKVSDYVSTPVELAEKLGDDSLANAFAGRGPVMSVRVKIKPSSKSKSGYYWSNDKGNKLEVKEGTVASCKIVVEKKKPITMLIPFLKEKLDFTLSKDKK